MPQTLDQLTDAALALSAEERAALIDRLIEEGPPAEVRTAQVAEVMRRREAWLAGKVPLIPGEQVMREAREICR